MSFVKFPPPRPLTKKESLDSLDHWRSQFRTFFKRDDTFRPFLRSDFKWDPNQDKFGFTGTDAQDESDNFEDFLNVLSGFLPHSYQRTPDVGMMSGTSSILTTTVKSQGTPS